MTSLEILKQLRERTSAGLSECKAVLEEVGGDLNRAVKVILSRQDKYQRIDADKNQGSRKVAKQDSIADIPSDWSALALEELIIRLNAEEPGKDILAAIKKHGSVEQRRAVALSSSAPPQIIQQLSSDIDANVIFAAKIGRKLPVELSMLTTEALSKVLPLLQLDHSVLERISRFPCPELQKAVITNQYVNSQTLEFLRTTDDEEVRERAFEKLLERGEEPVSELYVGGTGYELDIFEVSREQYELILETGDVDLVDDPSWGLVDQSQYSLPDDAICNLYVNGLPVELIHIDSLGKSYDEIGKRVVKESKATVTQLGKYYAIRAWENKGTWYYCKFKGRFDESRLSVEILDVELGDGENALSFGLFDIQYRDALPFDGDCSTRGKGVSCYLVDQKGCVTEL